MNGFQLFYRKISYTKERFFEQYKYITKNKSHHVMLESGRGGRYSIAGITPFAIVASTENGISISGNIEQEINGIPLRELVLWLQRFELPKVKGLPDFQGGAVGYISYDYIRWMEKLPCHAKDDLGMPLFYFQVYDEWAVFDHETELLWLMCVSEDAGAGEQKADAAVSSWEASEEFMDEYSYAKGDADELSVSLNEEEFKEAVEKVQEYIASGDVFQVNLSVRQSKPLVVPAFSVYEELRRLNPSPYMGYIHTPDFQIVSGSPELLVKKAGTSLSTRPIAGTRSRGKDEAEDLKLAAELIENEKERAEHVMLVDLERNDLGRVSKYGTVEVNEFMVIEKYSHVMHIVSNVRSEIAEGKNNADVIEAVFPGGTITGAPKIRTMEIIEELEPVRRGIYTGSIGWLGFNGDMELNIVIRTMLSKDGIGYIQAGAGVVIDSNPKHEYKESLKKAAAVWQAKAEAEKIIRTRR